MRNRVRNAVVLILLACSTRALGGAPPGQYSRISLSYVYNAWNEQLGSGESKLGESVLGIRINHLMTPRFAIDLRGTAASASYSTPLHEDINVSSLNDTRVKGTYYFGDRVASASLSLNLPTGKTSLTEEQYLLATQLADISREYALRRLGQGLDIGGDVFWLPRHGDVEFQIGAGYLYKGGYQVLEGSPREYKFGDEAYARVGVNIGSRPVGFLTTATVKTYSKDEFDSRPVYQSGNTAALTAQLNYAADIRGSVGFSLVARGKAKISGADGGGLTEEALKSGRNELLVYAAGGVPLGEQAQALGRVEYQQVTANGYAESSPLFRPEARRIGLGAGLGYQFTLNWSSSVMATYYSGRVAKENDLTGLGLAAVLTFRYW